MIIPKRMAFVWDDSRLSWLRYLTIASFQRLNPDWELRLYHVCATGQRAWRGGEAVDAQDYKGPDYSDLLGSLDLKHFDVSLPLDNLSPVHASDLARFQYLAEEGGWYSDLDILYVRPMTTIKKLVASSKTVFCQTAGVIGIGFLAGQRGFPLWQNVYQNALSRYNPCEYQSCGILALHDLVGTVQRLKQAYVQSYPVDLPSETVYPWDHKQVSRIFEQDNVVPSGCVGIHWFGGHPTSQQWNNRITRHTCRQFTNTISRYVQELAL